MTLYQAGVRARTADDPAVVEFMMRDRAWSAYALGYTLGGVAAESQVRTWEVEGRITGMMVMARLGQLWSVFLIGDPDVLDTLLAETDDLPSSGVFSAREEGMYRLNRHATVGTAYPMTRMVLRRGELRPRRVAEVSRLGAEDLRAVRNLYGMWTDSQQLPGQLQRGVYYGVFERGHFSSSQLVAVAGTHCIARAQHLAAIGNVLTRTDRRNQGLAATTTTAVAEELFALGCDDIVLNVREGNHPAMAAYRRLGFTPHCRFVEGVFRRGG